MYARLPVHVLKSTNMCAFQANFIHFFKMDTSILSPAAIPCRENHPLGTSSAYRTETVLEMPSRLNGCISKIFLMQPLESIYAMESADGVFFIQNLRIWSFSKTKSIPVPSGIFLRFINPFSRS